MSRNLKQKFYSQIELTITTRSVSCYPIQIASHDLVQPIRDQSVQVEPESSKYIWNHRCQGNKLLGLEWRETFANYHLKVCINKIFIFYYAKNMISLSCEYNLVVILARMCHDQVR